MTDKTECHVDGAVCVFEADRARLVIFVSCLGPRREDGTGSKYGLRRDDYFYHVGTIIAKLPIDTTVFQGEWCVPTFCAVVIQRVGPLQGGHCNLYRWDIPDVDEIVEITGNTDVCTAIHEARRWNWLPSIIRAETKDTWLTLNMDK